MKKLHLSLLISIFIFCIGFTNVNASTMYAYFDLDETDYFNIFWEFNNQTEMSKFLIQHNNGLLDYLISLGNQETGNEVSKDSTRKPNTVLIRKSLDNVYRIYVLKLNSVSITSSEPILDISSWTQGYVFTYDNFMNLQNSEFIKLEGDEQKLLSLRESIGVFGFWGKGDLTELYSTLFYSLDRSVSINSEFDKINLSYVYQDDKYYRFDSYKWQDYMWFGTWIEGSLLLPNTFDFKSNFDLTWFKQNPIVTDKTNSYFKGLANVLFAENNLTIPSGYESFTINSSNILFYLTYRGNVDADSNIYYFGNFSDIDFFTSSFTLEESLVKGKDLKFHVNSPNHVYTFNPLNSFELDTLTSKAFMFYTDDDKYSKTIYYDPEAYHFNLRYVGDSSDLVLTNNEGKHTYTASQVQKSYNQAINSDKGTVDSEKNEENQNNNTFDFSAATILSGFKNFITSVGALCTSLGVFLADLPPSLSGLIYSGVTMGIIAVIIKIIL